MRRFPSFHPVPVHNSDDKKKSQYWQILNCSRPNEGEKSKPREEVRNDLRDPVNGLLKISEDGPVGDQMANDLLSMVIELGLLDRAENREIKWPKHTEDYMNGKIIFSDLLLKSFRHSMMQRKGDQIKLELLLDSHLVMDPEPEAYLSPKQIIRRLGDAGWEKYDKRRIGETEKEFKNRRRGAQRNLNEALRFGALIGLLQINPGSKNPKYARFSKKINDSEDNTMNYRVRDRLRDVCLYWQGHKILVNMGTSNKIFSTAEGGDFLDRLFAYHLYRECGGGVRRSKLFYDKLSKSFKDFLPILKKQYEKDRGAVLEEGVSSADSKHSVPANIVKNQRKALKLAIQKKFSLKANQIPLHINIDYLQRAYYNSEDSQNVLSFFERNAGTRYDVTILSELAHKHKGKTWKFTNIFEPYPWQKEASEKWKENKFQGIVAAVTASGKTIMAMKAISDYVEEFPDTIVSVIVPTKVLMYQWAENFAEILGINEEIMGLRGDGFKDNFQSGKRVIVSIIDSARQGILEEDVEKIPLSTRHLMVADECHRYGGISNRTVFDTRFDAIIGLSATPPEEDEDEGEEISKSQMVINSIGNVFYNLRYKEALAQELISHFEVQYVSIPLLPNQDIQYDGHSKKIGKAIKNIRIKYGYFMERYSNRSLDEQLNVLKQKIPEIDSDKDVNNYRRETQLRRNLVWSTVNRKFAYLKILNEKLLQTDSQIMVFHERVSQLEEIVANMDERGEGSDDADKKLSEKLLKGDDGYTPAMYHSKQTPGWNPLFMQAFKEGKCRVMLSVKALAEGVDIPKADVGIIRVSTGSIRQRIQTIGRMLRRGSAEKSIIYIFHVTKSNWEPTVDCNILQNIDWEEQLGDAEITWSRYLPEQDELEIYIDEEKRPIPVSWEDRRPPAEVDVSDLKIGDQYPGRYEGTLISRDSKSNLFVKNSELGRIYIENEKLREVSKIIQELSGGGRIIITSQGHIITRIREHGTIFLGEIDKKMIDELVDEAVKSSIDKKSKKKNRTFEEMFG